MDWEGWLTSHLKDGGCALYLPQLSSLWRCKITVELKKVSSHAFTGLKTNTKIRMTTYAFSEFNHKPFVLLSLFWADRPGLCNSKIPFSFLECVFLCFFASFFPFFVYLQVFSSSFLLRGRLELVLLLSSLFVCSPRVFICASAWSVCVCACVHLFCLCVYLGSCGSLIQ